MLSMLPDLLIGVVVVLVLSASMSTLSSLVLTSSSTLTLDLLKDNIMKKMSREKADCDNAGFNRVFYCCLSCDRA